MEVPPLLESVQSEPMKQYLHPADNGSSNVVIVNSQWCYVSVTIDNMFV